MPLKGEVAELLETKQFTQSFLQKLEVLANTHQNSNKKPAKNNSPTKSQKKAQHN